MVKLFITFLLIVKGIAASDTCERCDDENVHIEKFPESNEDLRNICKPGIEYLECEMRYEENCGNPRNPFDTRSLQAGYGVLATVREVCSEDSLLHTAVVDNLKCFKKLAYEADQVCLRGQSAPELGQQFAEALIKDDIISFTNYENDTRRLYSCIMLKSCFLVVMMTIPVNFSKAGGQVYIPAPSTTHALFPQNTGMLNFFACQSLVIERACGAVAMEAVSEILQGAGPGVFLGCEEFFQHLPIVIPLRRIEEEKVNRIAEDFRKRK